MAKLTGPDDDADGDDSSGETAPHSNMGPDISGYVGGRPFFSNNANDKPK